ncbi:MAG: response regulator [Chloroflexi bacterium]|nr:response regulator [Chloroflexota bacterium]
MGFGALIMIVDDDENIAEFVTLALEDEGYKVITAGNGKMALEKASQAHPDLILLDMRMPVMDGWAFAEAYRREPGSHAPIIACTAARDAAQSAAEINAEGHLAKPFDIDELIQAVRRFTNHRVGV